MLKKSAIKKKNSRRRVDGLIKAKRMHAAIVLKNEAVV
jgi:hypothetical protein